MTDSSAVLLERAQAAARARDFAGAIELCKQAQRAAGSEVQAAYALALLGSLWGKTGHYNEAEDAFHHALESASNDELATARVRLYFGGMRWEQGRLAEAHDMLAQAEAGFAARGETRFHARATADLALVLRELGRYQHAIDALQRVLPIYEKLEDEMNVVVASNNLAECYCDLGAYHLAEPLLRKTLARAEQSLLPLIRGDLGRLLGMVLCAYGEHAEAREVLARARADAEGEGIAYLVAAVQIAQGDAALARGEIVEAEALARAVLEQAGEMRQRSALARLLLGQCYQARGAAGRARTVLESALEDARASANRLLILRCHAALTSVVSGAASAGVHQREARGHIVAMRAELRDPALRAAFDALPFVSGLG